MLSSHQCYHLMSETLSFDPREQDPERSEPLGFDRRERGRSERLDSPALYPQQESLVLKPPNPKDWGLRETNAPNSLSLSQQHDERRTQLNSNERVRRSLELEWDWVRNARMSKNTSYLKWRAKRGIKYGANKVETWRWRLRRIELEVKKWSSEQIKSSN